MITPAMAASNVIVFMSPLYAFTNLPRITTRRTAPTVEELVGQVRGLGSDPPSSTINSEFSVFVPIGLGKVESPVVLSSGARQTRNAANDGTRRVLANRGIWLTLQGPQAFVCRSIARPAQFSPPNSNPPTASSPIRPLG